MKYQFALSLLCLSSLSFTNSNLQAAAGNLDPRFGSGGKVALDFANTDDYAYGVAVQLDGRILVAGQSGIYPNFHAALARCNKDGTLDATFGTGGKVSTNFGGNGDYFFKLAIQSDGKIVAIGGKNNGHSGNDFLVARYNADGTPDATFGNGGWTTTTFVRDNADARAVVLQADGKIIVVGTSGAGSYSELNDFSIVRYNANGTLDPAFGNGGVVKTHFPGVFNTGTSATGAGLQSDGKLVVGGTYKNEGSRHQFALARYNANGTLDRQFGSKGKVITDLGTESHALDLAIQADDRIVLGGYAETGHENNDFALARYNADGTLDLSFDGSGYFVSDLFGASDDIANAIAIQPDGKLLVGGRTGQYPAFHFGLARYLNDGQFDISFGHGGKVETEFGTSEQAYGLALHRNGTAILAGYTIQATGVDFGLARYLGR